MKDIEAKVKEINDWADGGNRSSFIMVRDEGGQLNTMNASLREIINMLLGCMKRDDNLAAAVLMAAKIHSLRKNLTNTSLL